MGDNSKIEWTDASWSPIRARRNAGGKVGWHCEKVSAGCANCYSETWNRRKLPGGGTGLAYDKSSSQHVEKIVDREMLIAPLRWKKPRKVFVCSMTDLFGEWVTDEQLDAVFVAMSMASRHTFQVLTKRPRRMLEYLSQPVEVGRFVRALQAVAKAAPGMAVDLPKGNAIGAVGWELPNVWLGVSVEDQATADERIPLLLQTPAAIRFVSYEPALGPVDFSRCGLWLMKHWKSEDSLPAAPWCPTDASKWWWKPQALRGVGQKKLDWIIVGGESGPGARPFDVAWARSTIEQCRAAGVACFVKQLGAQPVQYRPTPPIRPGMPEGALEFSVELCDRKGGDMNEWPDDLRQREFPRVAVPR